MNTTIDEDRLKELLKAALIEVIEERRELLRDLLDEAIEHASLARAIDEGENTELIERREVMEILKANE